MPSAPDRCARVAKRRTSGTPWRRELRSNATLFRFTLSRAISLAPGRLGSRWGRRSNSRQYPVHRSPRADVRPFDFRSVLRLELQRRAVETVDALEGAAVRSVLERRQRHADLVTGPDGVFGEPAPDHEIHAGALDAPLVLAARRVGDHDLDP